MTKHHKKTLSFQTEVNQLLQLMIHSLYSHKEIFLRELISNASDALDKLRFVQIEHPEYINEELCITISCNKDAKTITIHDNGIGMTYDEVIENIGTIAKSGTKSFLEKLSGDSKKDANLIGQFGVGFYSAFIVASSVELHTRKTDAKPSEGVKWVSSGDGTYSIENINREDAGTTIVLHLREDSEEFAHDWQIRSLVRKYSDHINYSIKMQKMPEHDDDGKEIVSTEMETVNKASALWARSKNDISDEEYKEFYKHVSHDFNDPMRWIHAKVEGAQEYTELLYIPSQAPYDLYDQNRKQGIKLYVHRVFIMDDAEKLLPNYLRFIRGIIDSQNLPLNVSREILQSSKDIDTIRSGCTKKILSLLEDIATNDLDLYSKFWQEFGNVLKEGIMEDYSNKERIAKLLRFASTANDSDKKITGLDDYINRMDAAQDKIYYITAETYNGAKHSPHLEIFAKKDIEVLLLIDKIDEWVVSHLHEYQKKQLVSVTKADIFLKDEAKKEEEPSEEASNTDSVNVPLLDKIKEVLSDKVKDVKETSRLVSSSSCLVVDNNAMNIHLERILKQAGQSVPDHKPTLEVNLSHPLLTKLASLQEDEFKNLALVIYEQAALVEGLQLDDPVGFIKRLNQLIIG